MAPCSLCTSFLLVTAASSVAASRVNKIAMDSLFNELEKETAPEFFPIRVKHTATKQLTRLTETALAWLEKALDEIGERSVEEASLTWLKEGKCLGDLTLLLSNFQKVLNNVMFRDVDCKKNHYAYVKPGDQKRALAVAKLSNACLAKSELNLTQEFGEKSDRTGKYIINLCYPDFWKLDEPQQVATLIHEATHHWGTVDIAFTHDECRNLNTAQARNNAQNYAFFVMDVNNENW